MKADAMISQELEIADLKNKVEQGLAREEQLRDTLAQARELLLKAKEEFNRYQTWNQGLTQALNATREDLLAVESVVDSIPHWIVRLFWKRKK